MKNMLKILVLVFLLAPIRVGAEEVKVISTSKGSEAALAAKLFKTAVVKLNRGGGEFFLSIDKMGEVFFITIKSGDKEVNGDFVQPGQLRSLLAKLADELIPPPPPEPITPPPPPPTLNEKGYKLVPIKGPKFDKEAYITGVNPNVKFYWDCPNNFAKIDHCNEVRDGDLSGGNRGYPLFLWIHEKDLGILGGVTPDGVSGIEYIPFD